jgi:hypothetical protein
MIASLHRSMRIKAHAVSTELKALSAMTKCALPCHGADMRNIQLFQSHIPVHKVCCSDAKLLHKAQDASFIELLVYKCL